MSQSPDAAVGQVSPDGQFRWDGMQWVPIPRGERQPTPWTRPMQLGVAAFFVLETLFSIVTSALYVNHDTMLRMMNAQGTSIPQGTDINTVVSLSIVLAWIVALITAAIELVVALGSYLRWRWMFWVALVLLALGAIGALTTLNALGHPQTSPLPTWAIAASEVLSIVSLALFVWMLVGAIRYGPWAMKRPGS